MEVLAQFVARVRSGPPATHGRLTVVPLFGDASGPDVAALSQAITAGEAVVTEVGEDGSVPTLAVLNRGARPVLILDGEHLVGAKQNRIVNTSVLVAAGKSVSIPVSCVESGRWSWKSRTFGTHGTNTMPSMRASKSARLDHSLATGRGYDADQSTVWSEVAAYSRRHHVDSRTAAMSDVFEHDHDAIERCVSAISRHSEQTGLAGFVGGRFVALDIVGRADAYAEMHERLVRALAAQALDVEADAPADDRPTHLDPVLAAVAGASCTKVQPPGEGVDLRFRDGVVRGSALVTDGGVVHLAAFPAH